MRILTTTHSIRLKYDVELVIIGRYLRRLLLRNFNKVSAFNVTYSTLPSNTIGTFRSAVKNFFI